jgi:GNAT superfamily N-acetyltransferase
MDVAQFTPFGFGMDIYDAGREAGQGKFGTAGVLGAMALFLGKAPSIKGFRAGSPKGGGGKTFYALDPKGAEPYSQGGTLPINEVELTPNKIFDAKSGEGYQLYKRFLEETNHPAGRGKTGLPFWTVADDLADWLKSKGHKFDAIKFDENTGVPSIAILDTPPKNDISSALTALEAKYPDVKLDVSLGQNGLTLSRIVVPEGQRNQGVGTAIMEELTTLADSAGLPVALSPSSDFGGSVSRLKDFYSRFGFAPNKGRNKDFSISETHIRQPKIEGK